MSKLKIAVIGCGGIANQKHFPALKNNADLGEIVSFCDIRIERAAEAAKEYGAEDGGCVEEVGNAVYGRLSEPFPGRGAESAQRMQER